MCVQNKNSNIMNIDVPASVGAPPLNTQLHCLARFSHSTVCGVRWRFYWLKRQLSLKRDRSCTPIISIRRWEDLTHTVYLYAVYEEQRCIQGILKSNQIPYYRGTLFSQLSLIIPIMWPVGHNRIVKKQLPDKLFADLWCHDFCIYSHWLHWDDHTIWLSSVDAFTVS